MGKEWGCGKGRGREGGRKGVRGVGRKKGKGKEALA